MNTVKPVRARMLKDMQWCCCWGQDDPAAFSNLSWSLKLWTLRMQRLKSGISDICEFKQHTITQKRKAFCLVWYCRVIDKTDWATDTARIGQLFDTWSQKWYYHAHVRSGVMIWAFRMNWYYKNCCNVCQLSNPWTAEICNFIIFRLQYQLCQLSVWKSI